MAITAQRLLTELGLRKWSNYNLDDMVWGQDEARPAQTELNVSLRYLMNLHDFPFKSKEQAIETSVEADTFSMPEGQVVEIYNSDTLETLEFIGDSTDYDKELQGKPTHYWVEYNNPKAKIRLYPIPDGAYRYNIVYNQFAPVIDAAKKKPKFEFENDDDIINLPSHLEFLFMDCLILRTMAVSNKDEQDENYRPTLQEFEEAWRLFKKACKPKRVNARVVI
jgi:hypothetical protein